MISEDRAFFLKLVQPDLDEDDLDCWSSLIFTFYDRALKISFLPPVGPNVVIDLCLSKKTKYLPCKENMPVLLPINYGLNIILVEGGVVF